MEKDFLSLARKRYSSRLYQDQPIEKDKLMAILESARISPSAKNLQARLFYVITNPDMLQKVKECYPRAWIMDAPLIIVACSDLSTNWVRSDGKNFSDIDIAIAVDHMTLAAADLGIGSCWVCNFDKQKLVETLALPEHIEPVVMLPMGYPSDQTNDLKHLANRKLLNEIVHWIN